MAEVIFRLLVIFYERVLTAQLRLSNALRRVLDDAA
jgi:hypothetical protein